MSGTPRWSVDRNPDPSPGHDGFCIDELRTGVRQRCFLLPTIKGIDEVAELLDGTVVVAGGGWDRRAVWRIDPRTGRVADLGVVPDRPFASPDGRWLAWAEAGDPDDLQAPAARLHVRALGDEDGAVRAIDLGRFGYLECEFLRTRASTALCLGQGDAKGDGRDLVLIDVVAGTVARHAASVDGRIVLSPDERWVAYPIESSRVRGQHRTYRLVVQALDTGIAAPVTDQARPGQEPVAWVP